jgi:flagellum-specific peptidoglycan hydrolase FlgJ
MPVTEASPAPGTGPRAFIARLTDAFARLPTDLSHDAQDIVIAQGGLESGWARSRAAQLGRNFFNLCATPDWKGGIIESGDQEYDDAGHVKAIRQRFKAYPSDEAGIANYLHVLQWPRYLPAYRMLLLGNAAEFVRRLREDDPATPIVEGGFFTAPLARYQQDMAACLATVRLVRRTQRLALGDAA